MFVPPLCTRAEILMPFRQGPSWPPWLRWLNPSLLHVLLTPSTGTQLPLQLASLKPQWASEILTANVSLFVGHFWSWQVLLCLRDTKRYKACPRRWAVKLFWVSPTRELLAFYQAAGKLKPKERTNWEIPLSPNQPDHRPTSEEHRSSGKMLCVLREAHCGDCHREQKRSRTAWGFPKPKKMDKDRKINKTENTGSLELFRGRSLLIPCH